MERRSTKVLYLHGLESGPQAGKVLALRKAGFAVTAPALETGAVQTLIKAGATEPAAYRHAMELPVRQARQAVAEERPHVIVGSSFGGAVLLRLVHEIKPLEVPVVFLAQAGLRLTELTKLPAQLPCVLVHAQKDEVIPVSDSRLLAATSPLAVLVEVHDDHRLTQATRSGLLADLIALAAARTRA